MFLFCQTMLTRQSKVAPAVSLVQKVHPQKVQKHVARPARDVLKSKGAKYARTATPQGVDTHLYQVMHVPIVSEGPSSQDLATIVFGAVFKGLKTAGLISNHPQPTR